MLPTLGKIMKTEKSVYNRVPDDDEENASSDNLLHQVNALLKPQPPKWRRALPFVRNIILIGFAIWGIISLGFQAHDTIEAHKEISCDCGASIAEALTLGCKYDTLAAAWLRAECRDDELAAQFDTIGPGPGGRWLYWSDPHRKHEITVADLAHSADTGKPFFTEWLWHVAHCTYYWRKQERGIAYMDQRDMYTHIVHCEEIIMKGDRNELVMSGVGLNKSSFVPEDDHHDKRAKLTW
ncbi:hypothetical protein N0V90_004079 [Kalmusia sp. IMI 367209]|nr:hypothetical protein N0V90_004079 [Kalmusia sp. IMI 367209]